MKNKPKAGEVQCVVCGHKWIPRVENPQTCARCKSYKWNVKK